MPRLSARAPLTTKSSIVNLQSAILIAAFLLSHVPLLRLPYFWDETGYYIPAARDLFLTGSVIPVSTLTNAHPPLVMAWLAAAWKSFGYSTVTTRAAMLVIAAFTLAAVFRLARQVANPEVAVASVICTALYPVFFSQSAMAHLDLAAAGFILWGLVFYLGQRRWVAIILLSLACLAKETAALAPLALLLWELAGAATGTRQSATGNSVPLTRSPDRPITQSLSLLLSLVPLAAWFGFHYFRTGRVFGNPEFFRYNVVSTLNPIRVLAAFVLRVWHLFGYMNMFLLTIATALAMFLPAQRDPTRVHRAASGNGEAGIGRRAVSPQAQTVFYVLIVVHLAALSLVGGAALARYLLPVYPLVIVLCVSTLWRRVPWWPLFVGVICIGFVVALVVNPPYRFAPEDNLAWSDYVRLHQSADAFVAQRYPGGRVLTAWPAADELTRPWLGYVPHAVPILRIDDFSAAQVLAAADTRSQFRAALVFSTKYEPRYALRLPGWERLQERFFGYHRDLPPQLIARMLGARIVFQQRRGQQWVAVLETESTENVRLQHF